MVLNHVVRAITSAPPECHQRKVALKRKMTDQLIRSINPDSLRRIEICDTERVGLRFRMSPTGHASWIYQKKIKGGKRRGCKMGTYPIMSLKEARSSALLMQIDAERGIDSVQLEKDNKKFLEAKRLAEKSVLDILNLYINSYINQELKAGQSRDGRKRQLILYLTPYYNIKFSNLTKGELQSIIDNKQAQGKIVMANRIRAALRAFTGWAYKRGHIENDIGALLQSAGKEKSRERTPSLDEVKVIWLASFKMGILWGPYIRLCILTGQRCRSDILVMEWYWINFERSRYEIPNPKNGRPHIVHLCAAAIKELKELKILQSDNPSPFVFTTTGKTAASGVSKAKLMLDKQLNELWSKAGHHLPFEHWVLHDLRRSQATELAEAGIDEGVVDRIQNHVATGSRVSVVAAVYNKAQKLTERALALDAWARMVTEDESNIIELRLGAKS